MGLEKEVSLKGQPPALLLQQLALLKDYADGKSAPLKDLNRVNELLGHDRMNEQDLFAPRKIDEPQAMQRAWDSPDKARGSSSPIRWSDAWSSTLKDLKLA